MDNAIPRQTEEDAELVLRAQLRDRTAFEQLAGRFRGIISATVRRYVGGHEADDLVQDVLVRVWEHLPDLRDPRAFPAWISTLTTNACRRWYRSAKLSEVPFSEDHPQLHSGRPDPLSEVLHWEESRMLREALLAIPRENRQALIMHLWGSYAYSEIAERFDIPLSTVQGRIHRAKAQLRQLLGMADPTGSAFTARQGGKQVANKTTKRERTHPRPVLVPQIGHSQNVSQVAVSPDGRRFASRDSTATVIVWDLETGRQEMRITGMGSMSVICFSPDGRMLAVSGNSPDTFIYDLETGRQLASLRICSLVLEFDPDGKHLWTASWTPDPENEEWQRTNVFCWELKTQQIVRRVEGLPGRASALSQDARIVVTTTGKPNLEKRALLSMDDVLLHVWDMATGREMARMEGLTSYPRRFAVSPDTSMVASSAWGSKAPNDVFIWSALDGRLLHQLLGHMESVGDLVFSPDGSTLVSADLEGEIIGWDVTSGQVVQRLHNEGRIDAVAFTPDGNRIIVSAPDHDWSAPGGVRVWDWRAGQECRFIGQRTNVLETAAFSPDGRRLACGGRCQRVVIWDTESPRLSVMLDHPEKTITWSLAFSLSGRELLAGVTLCPNGLLCGGKTGQLVLWDLKDPASKRVLRDYPGIVFTAAFSPDGKWALSSDPAVIHVWRTDTWEIKQELTYPEGWIVGRSIPFAANGKTIASIGDEVTANGQIERGEIRLSDVESGETVRRWESERGYETLAFSPDGRTLAAGMVFPSTLGEPIFQILLLDVETGQELRELRLSGDYVGRVRNVAFSRDGAVLVASSWDGRLTIWNAQTGELIRATRRHSAWADPMLFSPDGQLLAVGTMDGAIVLWRVEDLLGSGKPREALTLLALDAGTQWLAYTPDGYYDCSPGAADCLLWQSGSEFLTMNQAASEYHRPDLLAKALAP